MIPFVEVLGSAGGGAAVALGAAAAVRRVRTGHVHVEEDAHIPLPHLCGSHVLGTPEHWCGLARGHKTEPHRCEHCDLTWPQAKE